MLDSLLFDGVQITRDQLNDVSEPVLANRGNHVNRDLVLNVLSVAVVRDAASVDAVRVSILWVHDSVILLSLISRLTFTLFDDIKLGASLIDVLITNDSSLDIDVETFARRGVVGTNFVGDR